MYRGIQGHPYGIFWRLHVPTICLRCSNIMVYVPAIYLWCCKLFSVLWLYMSYRFCVVIYLITKIYLSTKWWAWVNQHSMHLHSVILSKMLHLDSWLPYWCWKHQLNCLHFSSVAIIDLQVLLFNINIWVNFQLFLWQRSNFIKRFSDLICLICL